MTVEEIEKKFLVVNRNRRDEGGDTSESGNRKVMGRKGLGKLAGFGVAELVTVYTKRKGEDYATTINMDFNEIKQRETVHEVEFETIYKKGLSVDEQGTVITLSRLRCDSMRNSSDAIENIISQNFHVMGEDFKILLNGDEVVAPGAS